MRIPRLREYPDQPDAPRTESVVPSLYRIVASTSASAWAGIAFAIDARGTLVTCDHVVKGASAIRAASSDGVRRTATTVATRPEWDLAVLKIDAMTSPLPFCGDGQEAACPWVWLARHPEGNIGALERGIVERHVLYREGVSGIELKMQTRPGDSGNPILNGMGEIVGMHCGSLRGFPYHRVAVDAASIREFVSAAVARTAEPAPAGVPVRLSRSIESQLLMDPSAPKGKAFASLASKAYSSGQVGASEANRVDVLYQSAPPKPSFIEELVVDPSYREAVS